MVHASSKPFRNMKHHNLRPGPARLSLPHFLTTIVFFIGVVLVSVGLGLDNWLQATATTTNAVVKYDLGVWDRCGTTTPTGGVASACVDFDLATFVGSSCDRSNSDMTARMKALKGLFIAGGAMGLLTAFLSFTPATRASVGWMQFVSALLSLAPTSAGLCVWADTYYDWMFCGDSICDFVESKMSNTTCTDKFQASFYLIAVGCGLFFLGMLVQLVACARSRAPEQEITESKRPRRPSDATTAREPTASERASTPPPTRVEPTAVATTAHAPDKQPGGVPAAPEGDWVWDAESNMYWSEENQLYLHPELQHFWDPSSGMWYNPTTDTWYNAEEENE